MTLAQRLGFFTIDVNIIAGILAADMLKDYMPAELTLDFATQYLRTRYMQLVGRYGLPPAACDAIAQAGWRIVHSAGAVSHNEVKFAFYE